MSKKREQKVEDFVETIQKAQRTMEAHLMELLTDYKPPTKAELKKEERARKKHEANVKKVEKYAEKLGVDLYEEFGGDYYDW